MHDYSLLHRPAHLIAVACVIGEMLASTVSNVLLRVAATNVAPELTLFLRLLAATVILAPFFRCDRTSPRATRPSRMTAGRLARYGLCGIVSYLASLAWLYALIKLPLAVATSLFFTTALFMGAMSRWALAEEFSKRGWMALAVGLLGVVLVLRPSFTGTQTAGVIAALVAALLAALAVTQLKTLSNRESPLASAFLRLAPVAPLAAIPAIRVWSVPPVSTLTAIVLTSVLLIVGQALAAKAYDVLHLSQASALEYLRLVFATAAGVLVFGEPMGALTLIGGALILGAALLGTGGPRNVPRVLASELDTRPTPVLDRAAWEERKRYGA